MVELGFERPVEGVDKFYGFSRRAVETVAIATALVGGGDDKVVDACGFRIGSLEGGFVGFHKDVLRPLVYLLRLPLGQKPLSDDGLFELLDRIHSPGLSPLPIVPIEFVLVGVRVGVDADALGVDHDGSALAEGVASGFAHGVHGVEDILAITVDNAQIFKPRKVVGDVFVGRLFGLPHADAEPVVLDNKDDGKPFAVGPVDGLITVALAHGTLALGAKDDPLVPKALHSPGESDGVEGVVADARRDVVDVPLRLGEVVAHVAAAACGIGRLGNAIEDYLLDRKPRREDHHHVPVVGKEVVLPFDEDLPNGHLDGVVASTGGVVGPTDRLLEVIRCPIVDPAAEGKEKIPVL